MDVQELLRTIGDRPAATATVKNVYGEPVVVGDRTVIPIAQVCYAFGGGGGVRGNNEQGGGGGGGVLASPCGALEVTAHGTRFVPFHDQRTIGIAVAAGFVLGVLIASLTKRKRSRW